MDLRDRVALVTGASGGLGAVTAWPLAEDGVHVAVTHLGHRDEALDVCKQIEAMGRKAILGTSGPDRPGLLRAAVEATVRRRLAPQQQRRLERPRTASGPGCADAGDLGSSHEHEPSRPVPRDSSRDSSPQATGSGPRREHLRRPGVGSGRKHRPGRIEGGPDPSHALSRGRACALHYRQLHRAGAHGGHANVRAGPAARVAASKEQAALKRTTKLEDVARQVVIFCRSDSVTGQTQVIDAGTVLH